MKAQAGRGCHKPDKDKTQINQSGRGRNQVIDAIKFASKNHKKENRGSEAGKELKPSK